MEVDVNRRGRGDVVGLCLWLVPYQFTTLRTWQPQQTVLLCAAAFLLLYYSQQRGRFYVSERPWNVG